MLRKPQHLFVVEMVDVDADIGDHFCSDVVAVRFDVGDPMMSRVRVAFAVS